MLEMILPEYIRQLLENYQVMYSQLTSQLRWLYFDDAFRLVTRVSYLDDGWIRVRVDTGSALDINLVELLREMSWTFYSIAEVGRNLDMLKNALESVGTDRFRVVGELSVSELNITKVGGVAVTGRDWSQDFAKLQNLDIALSGLRDIFRPILKGSVFNDSVTANTNIFSSDLTPTNNPTTFRIYACFNASGVLSVVRTRAGTTVVEQLNGGTALSANCAYMFDILVESGETINLQYSVNATALTLKVLEIPSVIS